MTSTMAANSQREYYLLLVKLSQRLSKDDLKNLVFACGDVLPPSASEKIRAGTDLFCELKQRGHLGPTNYDYLREQLLVVGRNDLASMLPGQLDTYFGQESNRNKTYFCCICSPTVPTNISMPRWCPPSTSSDTAHSYKMFLLHLSEQITLEDAKKLAFLVCPEQCSDGITPFGLICCLARRGDITSTSFVDNLSICLDAIGRADLAQFLNSMKAPQALLSSLSTSQQQLDLKIGLLFHSKHQSYDFYMKTLAKLQSDGKFRCQVLSPVVQRVCGSYSYSRVHPLAQSLHATIQDLQHSTEFDSILRTSLAQIVKFSRMYVKRSKYLRDKELHLESFSEIIKECSESYQAFDSVMDRLEWNSEIRGELKKSKELGKTPIGSPADLACKYILELSQKFCPHTEIHREMQATREHLCTLNSIYYCKCYLVLIYQWLATLLCLSTSCTATNVQLDLSRHKHLLLTAVEQNKDNFIELYPILSHIIGRSTMQKLFPVLESVGVSPQPVTGIRYGNHQLKSPPDTCLFVVDVLLIKLLAVATLGPNCVDVSNTRLIEYHQTLLSSYETSHWSSHCLMVSAAAMKKQVEAFQGKILAEDGLCTRLVAALTVDDNS